MESKHFLLLLAFALLIIIGLLFWYQKTNFSSPDETVVVDQKKGIRYLPLGDSYTIGQGVLKEDRFPNQLAQKLNEHGYLVEIVANPSRTGYTTKDLLQYELPVLKGNAVDLISLLIGVNDQFQGIPAEDFRVRFQEVLATVIATQPKAKIVVVTIPNYSLTPQGKQSGDSLKITQELSKYNHIIKAIALEENIAVVDIWDDSLTVTENPSLLALDGLHPSKEQYALWVKRLLPEVAKLLNQK